MLPTISDTFEVREGRHLRVLQQRSPGLDLAGDVLLAHLDHPSLADTVVVAADHLAAPLDPVRAAFPGARIVVWQLGQLSGGPTAHPVPRTIQHLRGADAVWDHDTLNIAYLGWHRVAVESCLPVLWVAAATADRPTEPGIDVLFAGRPTERRQRLLERIGREAPEVRLAQLWEASPEELDRLIAGSRIVLNLHAHEPWHRQEQTRIARALRHGRMVVSEPSERNWHGDRVVEAAPDLLAATLRFWLADDRWRAFGAWAGDRQRGRSARWLAEAGFAEAADRLLAATPSWAPPPGAPRPGPDGPAAADAAHLAVMLRVHDAGSPLLRLGGPNDGGYVVPRLLLDRCERLVSVGMADDSRFEEDWFALTGKPVETYDGQWDCAAICSRWPEEVGGRIRHTRQNAGTAAGMLPLPALLAGREHVLLKIDAEGAEYDLLPGTDLGMVDGLILEVHDLDRADRREAFRAILRHLDADFALVHLHGQVAAAALPLPAALQGDGDGLPTMIELTFARRTLLPAGTALVPGPFPRPGLDAPCEPRSSAQPRDLQLDWVNRDLPATAPAASVAPVATTAPEPPPERLPVHQIWLTDAGDDPLPPTLAAARQTVLNAFPQAEHRLWRMADLRAFLADRYHPDVLWAFDRLRPYSYKADLGRFCLLHALGGWYADIGIRFNEVPAVADRTRLVAFRDLQRHSRTCWACSTSVLWSRPGHEAVALTIEQIVRHCREEYYGLTPLDPTGPSLLGQALAVHGSRADVTYGDVLELTPSHERKNAAFVTTDGTIVAWGKGVPGGNLTALGATGVNNYNHYWRSRQVYAPVPPPIDLPAGPADVSRT